MAWAQLKSEFEASKAQSAAIDRLLEDALFHGQPFMAR